jgi:signal peptidase I
MVSFFNEAHPLASATNEIIGDQLVAGAAVQFTITTQSMLPTIAPGDRVVARGVAPSELRIGEIAMIRDDQAWLAHRLIERRMVDGKLEFVTQGDNCLKPDGLWSYEQICGKIVELGRANRRYGLESMRARWTGAAIAFLLRHRPLGRNSPSLKINSALVRAASWSAFGPF